MGVLSPPSAGPVAAFTARLRGAVHGLATPVAATSPTTVSLARLTAFLGLGVLLVASSSGGGSLAHPASWWDDPIVLERAVVWAVVWELLGLGGGTVRSGRWLPTGGARHWLRPGTLRLPLRTTPASTRRRVVDVVLYVVLLGLAGSLLVRGHTSADGVVTLPRSAIIAFLTALGVVGLRDRTILRAARPELLGVLLVVGLFPVHDFVPAVRIVLVAAAVTSALARLHRHTPWALAAAMSAPPWPASVGRAAWRSVTGPTRPSRSAVVLAHGLTVGLVAAPVALLVARGGAPTVAALAVAAVVGTLLLLTSAAYAPSTATSAVVALLAGVVFGRDAAVGMSGLTSWTLIGVLAALLVGAPLLAARRPNLARLLPVRPNGANPPASLWLLRHDGVEDAFVSVAGPDAVPLGRPISDADRRAQSRRLEGRMLDGLVARAVDDPAAYTVWAGDPVVAALLGWTSGQLVDEALVDAVQERCGFARGQLRVISVEAQPLRRPARTYRIFDAADGRLEEGTIRVADAAAGPGFDVHVVFDRLPCPGQVRIGPGARPQPRPRTIAPLRRLPDDPSVLRPRPAPRRVSEPA